jgi:S1-C subfamily serine protease
MDDFDRLPTFEPLTPRVAAPGVVSTDPPAPTTRPAISSRPASPIGRGLVGVLAISLVTATLASVVTVGVLTAGTAAPTAPAAAASPAARTISADDAVVAVAESASPAVVTISTDSAGNGDFGPFSMPSTGVGSGFVFDADGLILTNDHVIEGATGRDAITVAFQDGTELPATVVATDPDHDLAVLKVEATGLPTIEIGDSDALKVGQLVIAIGSPLGTFTESVTSGILSATGRTIEVGSPTSRRTSTMTDLLQTDAAINEGNSGGPLLDASGRVVGVNVAVAASAQGIGFAVPIDAAAAIIAEARAATDAA